MQAHPAAEVFPLLQGPCFEALRRDIERHGQLIPIEIWEGKIIDGRSRYEACRILGIEPKLVTLKRLPARSPLEYVLSANLHRRHLGTSQRAMVGARARAYFDREARSRKARRASSVPENFPGERGDARDQAGAVVGVSGKTIDAATVVLRKGVDEVIRACDDGRLAVSRAANLVQLPKDEQIKAIEGGKEAVKAALQDSAVAKQGAAAALKALISRTASLERTISRSYGSLSRVSSDPQLDDALAGWIAAQAEELARRFSELAERAAQARRRTSAHA